MVVLIICIENVESGAAHSLTTELVLVLHHVQSSSLICILVVHELPPLHISVVVFQPAFLHVGLLLREFPRSVILVVRGKVFVETVSLVHEVRAGWLWNVALIMHSVVVVSTVSVHQPLLLVCFPVFWNHALLTCPCLHAMKALHCHRC